MNKSIISIAIALASMTSFCGIVASNLGSKQISHINAKTSFENPYITDGLIAMWDGEWNVGFGKHNSESSIWVDLSGNKNDLTTISGSFGDNYFDGRGKNSAQKIGGILNIQTIECVILTYNLNEGSTVARNIIVSGISDGNSYGKTLTLNKVGLWTNVQPNGIVCIRFMGQYANNQVYHISARYENDSYHILVNGNQIESTGSTMPLMGYQPGNRISIGYRQKVGGVGDYDGAGYIYIIRLYEKPLTEEEVLHNYKVDKERFNLQ